MKMTTGVYLHASICTSMYASAITLPREDVMSVKSNLVILVCRMLTQYIESLACLAKVVPQRITHEYSKE